MSLFSSFIGSRMLEETRTSMEEIVAKMLFIKKEGRPKAELRELITQFSLFSVFLRQINRSILRKEDCEKAETERAKAPVYFTTLQLQNLMYEKNHYMKAIKACKDFKSKHPDIELVPEEEFFNNAPEEIKGGVLAEDNAHDLMLKRLNFELFQVGELTGLLTSDQGSLNKQNCVLREKPPKKETKKEAAAPKASSFKRKSKDGDEDGSKKRKPKKKKDHNALKIAMSAFMFFLQAERDASCFWYAMLVFASCCL